MNVDRDSEEEVDRDVAVDVDSGRLRIDETRTTTTRIDVDDLFGDDGRLKLWADGYGWSGFERRDGAYFEVNVQLDAPHRYRPPATGPPSEVEEKYLDDDRVVRERVEAAIRDHVENPDAGGEGRVAFPATPP